MISSLDYKIYKAIQQDKKLTEIYLGYQELDWYYTKARYSATCTEAIEFTLFDKTICGLLQIEEHLSLEEIGGILGFNVIDNPSEKRYKDNAEYEILKEALQSLQEYEMIEGGDIDFSYCTLTTIGKEYVEKGKKFKIHQDKEFDLFFDYTSKQHDKAKENFEFIKGERAVNNESVFDYEDEGFLKSFAEKQIPNIYNPEKLNSFKDTVCLNKTHYRTILYRIFLLDISTGKPRVLVFDDTSNKINDFFTDYIIAQNYLIDFNSYIATEFEIKNYDNKENILIENLIDFQDKIDLASEDENPENVLSVLNEYYNNSVYIEPELFFVEIERFVKQADKEIWLSFDEINEKLIAIIFKLFDVVVKNNKYLFLSLIDDTLYENQIEAIIEKSESSDNIFVLVKENIPSFNYGFDNAGTWLEFRINEVFLPVLINGEMQSVKKPFIFKSPLIDYNKINHLRNEFAEGYFDFFYKDIAQVLIDFNYEEQYDIQEYNKLLNITKSLHPFTSIEKYKNKFNDIEQLKQAQIIKVKDKRSLNIIAEITKVSDTLSNKKEPTYVFLEKLYNQIEKEKEKCLEEEMKLFIEIETKLKNSKKDIELASKRKSIIIDTNVLLEEPNIIEIIGINQTIVLSAKVLDELDYLKTRKGLKENAQSAFRNISKHQNDKNILLKLSNTKLLPVDFDKNSPDNLILSVALQYTKRNPILLTNDKGMSLKAKTLEIPAKTINELKKILDLSKVAYSKKTNKNSNRNKRNK